MPGKPSKFKPGGSANDKTQPPTRKAARTPKPRASNGVPQPRGNRVNDGTAQDGRDRVARQVGQVPTAQNSTVVRVRRPVPYSAETRKVDIFAANGYTPPKPPTTWQTIKSQFSLARWGLKTYRSKKRMAEPKGTMEGFPPPYDPDKNKKRGMEGAQAATGGLVAGAGMGGIVLAALVWWRSVGGELPWPASGDIGFSSILGAVLTPIGAYVAGRINNKAKYNKDAKNGNGE